MADDLAYYGFIYITTNIVNGKKYIGKRKYDRNREWVRYIGSGVLLRKAVNKYGKASFNRIIIDKAFSLADLNEKEKFWIEFYDAIHNDSFYNIASGGDGGNVRTGYSDEQYRMSENKRISAVKRGHIYGEQVKSSILTESDVSRIIEDIKMNTPLAEIGRKYNISEMTVSDIKNKRTWKHITKNEDFSTFTVSYVSTRKKPVGQFDKNMNLINTYESAREAEKCTGIGYKMISKVCHGERRSTNGYIFKFI